MAKRVVAVTGCLGFMGSHFTRACLARDWRVWGIDKITYAARPQLLEEFRRNHHFRFSEADIADLAHLFEVDLVVNFAAETHVDNSILDPQRFLRSNTVGVQNLLELIRGKRNYELPVLVQISTDEVYGDVESGVHAEDAPLRPSNPYSASKAAADMLILGSHRTYELPFQIIRPSNNYGEGQYPEKLIPKSVKHLTLDKHIPIHGKGDYVRCWLHVDDLVAGVMAIIDRGAVNTIYNLPGPAELANLEVVRRIVDRFFGGKPPRDFQEYVKLNYVRMGEDVRYSMSGQRVAALGWKAQRDFDAELEKLVLHYRDGFTW
jgi:dTDP-glucose 4,6-dehydratase